MDLTKLETNEVIALVALLISLTTFVIGFIFNWKLERRKRRPILVFDFDTEKGWFINNVGNGPALNVILAFRGKESKWKYFVRVPSIAINSRFHISWMGLRNIWELGSVYTDYQGLHYTTLSKHDENRVAHSKKIEIPTGFDVPRHWNHATVNDPSIT